MRRTCIYAKTGNGMTREEKEEMLEKKLLKQQIQLMVLVLH